MSGKHINVSLVLGELLPSVTSTIRRSNVDAHGAKGVFDGFGLMGLAVNDSVVATIRLHEDAAGSVVLDLSDVVNGSETLVYRIPIEDRGFLE